MFLFFFYFFFFSSNLISIATSTLVDPYLITNGFNNSLISQDDSFKRTAIPEPVLKWRESVVKNHSALDLPEPMVSKLDPTGTTTTTTTGIRLHDDDDDDNKKLISCTYLLNLYILLPSNCDPKNIIIYTILHISELFKSTTTSISTTCLCSYFPLGRK